MRHIPFSPDLDWTGGLRWLCQLRLTCDDVTRRYGIPFVANESLPGAFGALVEIDGLRFLVEGIPQASTPMNRIVVTADGNIRSPQRALDIVLPAFDCTSDDVEALCDDLSEWPWMLTCGEGRDARRVAMYVRDEEEAMRHLDHLRRRQPERDYRVERAR